MCVHAKSSSIEQVVANDGPNPKSQYQSHWQPRCSHYHPPGWTHWSEERKGWESTIGVGTRGWGPDKQARRAREVHPSPSSFLSGHPQVEGLSYGPFWLRKARPKGKPLFFGTSLKQDTLRAGLHDLHTCVTWTSQKRL